MSKTFPAWDVDQEWLLPASVHDFVPAGHLAHFAGDGARGVGPVGDPWNLCRGAGLSSLSSWDDGGSAALCLQQRCLFVSPDPQACEERVDFMAVTGLNMPDFRTISEFRRRHLAALSDLFAQVLKLCQAAGLVKLGHVAVDGTKLKANASRHKAMSYGRMKQAEPKLKAEVEAWLQAAEATDRAEDAEHGVDLRDDEMPDWVADKQKRLERIRSQGPA